ncbi:putative integral membrane protein [Theileria parva strain Muguga]|uniref:putative integral membrane protein n=1 Tax=Theileria parva strain Muguga TaxID=333668 RepID=UPI001C61B6DF|nr:putative integral membrane protein [Theileria parva strain Muguga]KAF5153274.1 putative integral membrane protein [Theileria parva strain Muguga]
MLSVNKIKVISTLSNVISVLLNSCLIVFCFYLVMHKGFNLGILVVDAYFAAIGIVFALFCIYSVIKVNLSCLLPLRTYYAISGFFMAFCAVLHTLTPLYSTFEDEPYTTENAYYLAATTYILCFIQNLYSFFLTHSLIQHKRIELENEGFESMGEGKSCSLLNVTAASNKLGAVV